MKTRKEVNDMATEYLKDFGVTNVTIWEVREAYSHTDPAAELTEYRRHREAQSSSDEG